MSLACLREGLGTGSPVGFTKQTLLRTWTLEESCRVGGCRERRQPQQGRSSRAPSIIQPPSNTQLTWFSLTGCCEPWVGVGNWWEADPAASLLQLQFDGYNAWLLAWASNPDLPSVWGFDSTLCYRLFLKKFMGQKAGTAPIANSLDFERTQT